MTAKPERSHFAGALSIVRYNWPIYLVAGLIVVGAALVVASASPPLIRVAWAGLFGALWFLSGSLTASYWVYDRSALYRWRWLRETWSPRTPEEALISVSGFDEVSAALKNEYPEIAFQVLDHFDPVRMTEKSVHRARRAVPPGPDSLVVPYDRWPALTADIVLAPLSLHELRREEERAAWFAAARSTLRAGGRIVVVEHVRDLANFLVFGPGALHFHSAPSWRRCWQRANLQCVQQFRITPFVRVFVLQ